MLTFWRDRARLTLPCESCQSAPAKTANVAVRVKKIKKRAILVRMEQMRKTRERTPM